MSTGWNRRSSAASFSTCLRYSFRVVAPMQCSSPRASMGLSMLPASDEPSVRPAPTMVWISSMNRMNAALGCLDLGEHGLEALLEFAAVLGAGQERAQVQGPDAAVLQPRGHVAMQDALGEALDHGRLAYARLADEHRVVLRLARQNADDAADLGVAADDGVQLALAGEGDQVRAVLAERILAGLGILAVDLAAAAQGGERSQHGLAREPRVGEQTRGGLLAAAREQREQQVLHRDEGVPHRLRLVLGAQEELLQAARRQELSRAAATDLGAARQLGAGCLGEGRDVDLQALEEAGQQALLLLEQREQQVLNVEFVVAGAQGYGLGGLQGLLGLSRQTIGIHAPLPGWGYGACPRLDGVGPVG